MTSLSFHPVTCERLSDLACFSAQHGKFRYCSCMRWRMRSTDFGRSTKEGRVAALERLVLDGKPIGVLAYLDGEPVGWCSVAPRESYDGLERYSALARIDAPTRSDLVLRPLSTCHHPRKAYRRGSGLVPAANHGPGIATENPGWGIAGLPCAPTALLDSCQVRFRKKTANIEAPNREMT